RRILQVDRDGARQRRVVQLVGRTAPAVDRAGDVPGAGELEGVLGAPADQVVHGVEKDLGAQRAAAGAVDGPGGGGVGAGQWVGAAAPVEGDSGRRGGGRDDEGVATATAADGRTLDPSVGHAARTGALHAAGGEGIGGGGVVAAVIDQEGVGAAAA